MLDIQTALRQGTKLLEDGGVNAPRLTAEVLLCHALRKPDRSYLYAHSNDPLPEVGWIHFGRYLHERLKGKPTQYITKRQEFYGREFRLTRDVLIPRPETEHLVEAAIPRISPGALVLDAGVGSGAIAVTLALETKGRLAGCDLSAAALAVASANAVRLGARVEWVRSDFATCFAARSLDVLVSNPPYVPRVDEPGLQREVRDWEPHLALFAGPTGVENYERLIGEAREVLKPGGWLLFELGHNALEPVEEMLRGDWGEMEVVQDLAGFPRVIAARLG